MAKDKIEEPLPGEKASPLIDPLTHGLKEEVVLTDAEKERFFKCFLSDQLYVEEVSLFGKWKLKFKALSVEENDDVMKQIAIDQERQEASSNDSYLITIMQYRLGQAILSLNGVPFCEELTREKVPFNRETGESYIKSKAKMFAKWPMYKLAAVTEAFRNFEQKIQKMAMEVTNESFWKAVA